MKSKDIISRIEDKFVGERIEKLREDAMENKYEVQIVKERGIWTSDKWKPNSVKISVENAIVMEIIENDQPIKTEKYEGYAPPESKPE